MNGDRIIDLHEKYWNQIDDLTAELCSLCRVGCSSAYVVAFSHYEVACHSR